MTNQTLPLIGTLVILYLSITAIGTLLSAGLWTVGAFSNNYTQSVNGKNATIGLPRWLKGQALCGLSIGPILQSVWPESFSVVVGVAAAISLAPLLLVLPGQSSQALRAIMRTTVYLAVLPLPIEDRADFAETRIAMLYDCEPWNRLPDMSSILLRSPLTAMECRQARRRLRQAVHRQRVAEKSLD
jgi:hypothetical protein